MLQIKYTYVKIKRNIVKEIYIYYPIYVLCIIQRIDCTTQIKYTGILLNIIQILFIIL